MVDIISHKNPRVQILDVTNSDDLTERFLNTLRIDNAFKRFRSYSRGNFSPEGELSLEAVDGKQLGKGKLSKSNAQVRYDLIIVGDGLTDSQYGRLTELVASDGIILKMAAGPSKALDGFTSICTDTTMGHTLEVSMPLADSKVQKSFDGILIVEEAEQDSFNEALAKHLSTELGQNVKRVLLQNLTKSMITAKSLVISTIELSRPVLSSLTGEEMQSVKCITDNALSLLWLTGGNNMEGSRPDFALMSGLSRALMLEQPSLQITMLDLDIATPTLQTLQNITIVLRQSAESTSPDAEYVQKNDLLHISRMVPEEDMNRSFRDRQGLVPSLTPLSEAKPARLTIGTVGQFDTLAFSRESPDLLDLKPGTVEIEVKSVGLNAKVYIYILFKIAQVAFPKDITVH
jgi:hypothetical protein